MTLSVIVLSLLLAGAAAQPSGASTSPKNSNSNSRQKPLKARANVPGAEVSTPPWLVRSGKKLVDDDDVMPRKQPAAGGAQHQTSSPAANQRKRFIVQLKTPSAAAALQPVGTNSADANSPSNTGVGADGFRSIRPGRITPRAAAASTSVLSQVQAVAAAAGVSEAQVTHRYSYALSGFAVQDLTAAQMKALAADPQVLSVTEDNLVQLATYTTPNFLGLTGKGVRTSSDITSEPQYYGGGRGSGHHHSNNWGLWDEVSAAAILSSNCHSSCKLCGVRTCTLLHGVWLSSQQHVWLRTAQHSMA